MQGDIWSPFRSNPSLPLLRPHPSPLPLLPHLTALHHQTPPSTIPNTDSPSSTNIRGVTVARQTNMHSLTWTLAALFNKVPVDYSYLNSSIPHKDRGPSRRRTLLECKQIAFFFFSWRTAPSGLPVVLKKAEIGYGDIAIYGLQKYYKGQSRWGNSTPRGSKDRQTAEICVI